jgi:nicotinate-nucleotide adenylyltransferase
LATQGSEGVQASALEIERGGTSYTVDTLRAVHARDPESQLTLLVGADVALTLPSWREPVALLGLARLAVARRSEIAPKQVLDALAPLGAPSPAVRFLEMGPIEVSSSLVRERLREGERVRALLEPAVEAYIYEHGLYGARAQAQRR